MPLGKGDRQPQRHLGAGARVWVEGFGVVELLSYTYRKDAFRSEPEFVSILAPDPNGHRQDDKWCDNVPWKAVWELIYRIEEEP